MPIAPSVPPPGRSQLDHRLVDNRRRSALLVAASTATVAAVAWVVGLIAGAGAVGLGTGLLLAVTTGVAASQVGDALILRISRARLADPVDHARFHNLVGGLCASAGISPPELFVIDDPALNAFSTGSDPAHAALVVTTGLLETLDRVELEGVLAHELSHVKSGDTLPASLAVTLVGLPVLVADVVLRARAGLGWRMSPGARPAPVSGRALGVVGLPLLVLAPAVAGLLRLAVDRRREPVADLAGASLTRYPPALASALEKLAAGTITVGSACRATAHLWFAFPLDCPDDRLGRVNRRFAIPPSLEERLEALKEL
ncbi:MAG: M48 family metalloprotease [Acidimicrobiales bacterium]